MIIKVAYGYQIEDVNDDLLRIIEEAMDGASELNKPGKYLVEIFPFRMFNDFFNPSFSEY